MALGGLALRRPAALHLRGGARCLLLQLAAQPSTGAAQPPAAPDAARASHL